MPHQNGSSRVRLVARGAGVKALSGVLADAVTRAADGGFITDAHGRIILWNGAAEAMLGYARDDVLGRRCCDLFRGADGNGDGAGPDCTIGGPVSRGEPIPTFDLGMRTKAGLTIWLNVSMLLLRDRRNGGPFVLHLFRDVTLNRQHSALAHDGPPADPPSPATGALTHREREVLSLIGEGLNTAAIAERLHLSRATVRNHAQNILLKLNVHSRLEAVAYARRHHLL